MEWLNTILQGILLGGLYAMFAAGLSLIFGVMRLVNIAHGDLIVLAAYIALVTVQALGINPVWLMFALLAFGALFGFVGLLLAVPLAAIVAVLIRFGISKYKSSALYSERNGTDSGADIV